MTITPPAPGSPRALDSGPVHRFLILARVLTDAALRAAGEHLIALYSGIAIVSAILFLSPNGMDARDVTHLARGHAGVRVALTLLWLTAALPAARALTVVPSTLLLRTLPVPRAQLLGVNAAHLALAELPWLILWGRGEGAALGLGAWMAVSAAHAWLIVGPRGIAQWATAAATAAVLASAAPSWLLLGVGAISMGLGMSAVFRRAPEQMARGGKARFRGPAALALAWTFLLVLARRDPAARTRALFLTLLGVAAATLLARNNRVHDAGAADALSLGVESVSLCVALLPIAASVCRSERRERWLLDAAGISDGTRARAVLLAVAAWGVALGVAHGVAVSALISLGPLPSLRLATLGAAWGGGLAMMAVAAVRHAERRVDARGSAEVDGTQALLSAAAVVLGSTILLGLVGEAALAGLLPTAAVLGARAAAARTGATTARSTAVRSN